MSDTSVTQKPRREVWLQIALAEAKGMPEPGETNYRHAGVVWLYVDTMADADRWAAWCGLSKRGDGWIPYYGLGRDGYQWHIAVPESSPPSLAELLAEQVVAAITTAPSTEDVAA